MRFTAALRWGLYDRLLAFGSFALGLGLIVGGLWIGTGGWFLDLLAGSPGGPPTGTNAAIAVGSVLAGLFVWQLGSAAARHRTMVTATKHELTDGVGDTAAQAGDVEAQLTQLESDVEEVRRVTSRIEQSMRAGEFDADGLDQTGGGGRSATGDAAIGASSSGGDDASSADGDAVGAAADQNVPEVEFSEDSEGATTTGAAVGDGGSVTEDAGAADAGGETTAADDGTDAGSGGTADDRPDADGFEWPEEDGDGEYYRNS